MDKIQNRKTKQTLCVVESSELAAGVFSLILQYAEGCGPEEVRPGQFVGVYTHDSAHLLPRPISVCEWDPVSRNLRLVYRVVGSGTEEFSRLKPGNSVDVLGILGNGYDVSALSGKRVLLLGGGIGAPPMLGLAECIAESNSGALSGSCGISRQADDRRQNGRTGTVTAVMGYRTDDLFLTGEFEKCSRLIVATDDGTAGIHGNVIDAVHLLMRQEREMEFDVICACGPMPMLRGVKRLSEEMRIPAYLSLEERMACGVGACLGCVTRTAREDGHSYVHNARVCAEGPVFRAEDVEI